MSNVIKIAIIGLGQVGNYLYRELNIQRKNIEIKTAKKIKIIALSAKSKTKKRKYHINKKIFYKNPIKIIKELKPETPDYRLAYLRMGIYFSENNPPEASKLHPSIWQEI